MTARRGLGRGLEALIKDGTAAASGEARSSDVQNIAVESVRRGALQPRRRFEDGVVEELAQSIRVHGVLQPLLVRPCADGFELIAGERRLRAAQRAGLAEVPAVVVDAADRQALEMALVENVQREDLNALEEAEAYRMLAETFGLTQENIADRVGKARASVANTMRMLTLPDAVRDAIGSGLLSAGHAKALLALDAASDRLALARRAVEEQLSVRALEKLVQRAARAPRKPRAQRQDIPPEHLADLTEQLHRHFGTGVRIASCRTLANGKKRKGRLEIDFYSGEDLDRILGLLGIRLD